MHVLAHTSFALILKCEMKTNYKKQLDSELFRKVFDCKKSANFELGNHPFERDNVQRVPILLRRKESQLEPHFAQQPVVGRAPTVCSTSGSASKAEVDGLRPRHRDDQKRDLI